MTKRTFCEFFSLGGGMSRILRMACRGGSLKNGGSPSTISIIIIPKIRGQQLKPHYCIGNHEYYLATKYQLQGHREALISLLDSSNREYPPVIYV